MRFFTSFLLGVCILFGIGNMVSAGISDWTKKGNDPLHCARKGECTQKRGIDQVSKGVTGINTTDDVSTFSQKVVNYLLGFTFLVAVIMVIYAGFQLLVGGGDDEKMGNAKKIIISAAIGLVLMWLAYAIVDFILRALN